MTGQIVHLGGAFLDSSGYDLLGVMTGSEGLLGVITEVTVRLLQKPETARAVLIGFATVECRSAESDATARLNWSAARRFRRLKGLRKAQGFSGSQSRILAKRVPFRSTTAPVVLTFRHLE